MKLIFIAMMSLVLFSCENKKEGNTIEAVQMPSFATYLGRDIDGEIRECSPSSSRGEVCTMEYGPGDAYADDCRDRGFEAVACGCHDYICQDVELHEGVDIDGQKSSCIQMPADVVCDSEFTEGDQFASDCETDGGTAIQCGCHSYICKK